MKVLLRVIRVIIKNEADHAGLSHSTQLRAALATLRTLVALGAGGFYGF